MSTWKIYRTVSGTAQEIAECVSLEFHDTWMGEEFVTVSITSPTPVELQVGDYLTYRGATYTIYSLPTALKTARINSYGEAFKYDGVKLSARSTELTDIRFLDIVLGDNNLHYTSLPTFPVYCQTVDDLVDRLQANTDRYGIQWFFITPNYSRTMQRYTGTASVTAQALWEQYYGTTHQDTDAGTKEVNISVDKMSVWDGLAFIKNYFGLNFITRDRSCVIGAPGVVADHIFRYGKGNGLYEIERTADQDQQIVTKLFAYGSDKNLPLRYYATIGNDMPNNMAVNVLMLPGFPQYSLSQLCRLTYYTDGTGSRHTKVQIRKTPSASYSDIMDILGEYTIGFSDNKLRPYITSGNVSILGVKEGDIHFTEENDDNGLQEVYPSIEGMTAGDAGVSGLPSDERLDEILTCDVITDNGVFAEGATIPNFNIYLKPLGFDLKQAYDANGGSMVIHLNDGYCGGRDFAVKSVVWEQANNRWKLNVERHHDEALDLYFPYSWAAATTGTPSADEAYQIRTGDHFVLTEIEISDTSYIWAASVKALRKAITWLLNNDYTRFTYLPKVDEIFMAREHDAAAEGTSLHDTLKAGDVMSFQDEDLDIIGDVFIDSLTIKENGNEGVPTYDVVLRNDKQVGAMQRLQNQINSLSSFVAGGGGGMSIQQIRQLINTYGSELYLSKLNDDTAQGWITILQGIRTLEDFIELSEGGAFYTDENTLAHLTADVARIRERILGTLRIGDTTASVQTEPTLHVGGDARIDDSLEVHEDLNVTHDAVIGEILTALNHIYTNLLTSNNYTDDSAFGTGFSLSKKKGNENRSYLVVDELFVRWKAIFNELEIRRISYTGGNRVSSHAASKIVKVKDIVKKLSYTVAGTVLTLSGQVNVIGQTLNIDGGVTVNGTTATLTTNSVTYAKRCYAMKDDGTTATMNWWRVNDQARCQTFNIVESGNYQSASNKSYWRRVLEVGYEKIEIDGALSEEMYDYVDLSIADCMTGSDLPEAGDTIVQMGNRTDTSRQGFIVSEVAGESAPDIQIFRNVNSYTLEGKRKIILSPDDTHLRVNSLVIETEYDARRVPMERGDWDAIPEHKCYYYDLVQYNGATWLCIFPESGTGGVKYTTEPPSESSLYWQIYAQKGADGKDGKDGKSFNILGSYDTEEELIEAHPTGQVGDAYIVAGYLYVWDEENSEWHNSGQIKGDTGRGISSVTISYGKSNSSTTIPSTWYSSVDAVGLQAGDYLFTRMVYNYTDGEPAQSEPVYSIGYIGRDGSSPIVGDIDNEVISVACDKDGKVLAEFNKTISVKIYNGSTPVTLKDNGLTVSSASGITIDQVSAANGTFRVHIPQNNTIAQANNFTVTATANIGGADVSRVMSFVVNGVRQGADGTPSTIYELLTSLSSIKKDKDGTPDVNTITATKQKTVGNVTSETTDGTLKYKIDGGSEQTYSSAIQTSSISTGIEFIYYIGNVIVDRETIPVIMDGQNGTSVEIDSSNTFVRYSTVNSAQQPADNTFTLTTPPSLSAGDYLWSLSQTAYVGVSNILKSYSVSRIGEKGDKGDSITKASDDTYRYAVGDSGITPPSSGWSSTKPSTFDKNKWLWTETTIHWSDDSTTVLYSAERNPNDGAAGQDIVVDGATVMKYAVSNNNTQRPTVWYDYSDIASQITAGTWLWSEATTYYRKSGSSAGSHDAGSSVNYSVSYNGTDGAAGRALTSMTEYYKATNSNSPMSKPSSASGWDDDPNLSDLTDKWDANHIYLWNMEQMVYTESDGSTTTDYTIPKILAIWTKDGDAGRGIDSIVNHYMISNSLTPPEKTDSGWSDTPVSPTARNPYLWNYETITWVNPSSTTETDVQMIGYFGKDGISVRAQYSANGTSWHDTFAATDKWMRTSSDNGTTWSTAMKIVGENGAETDFSFGISQYKTTADAHTAPSDISTWSGAPIAVTEQKPYLWSEVKQKNGSGTVIDTSYIRMTGEDGTSVTIDTTNTFTKYQKGDSGTTIPTGTWQPTIPPVEQGKYLWTWVHTEYSDGNYTDVYTPTYQSNDGTDSLPLAYLNLSDSVVDIEVDENGKATNDFYEEITYTMGAYGKFLYIKSVSVSSSSHVIIPAYMLSPLANGLITVSGTTATLTKEKVKVQGTTATLPYGYTAIPRIEVKAQDGDTINEGTVTVNGVAVDTDGNEYTAMSIFKVARQYRIEALQLVLSQDTLILTQDDSGDIILTDAYTDLALRIGGTDITSDLSIATEVSQFYDEEDERYINSCNVSVVGNRVRITDIGSYSYIPSGSTDEKIVYCESGYVDITVTYRGVPYTKRWQFYCNLLGTWKSEVENDTQKIVAQRISYVVNDGDPTKTIEQTKDTFTQMSSSVEQVSEWKEEKENVYDGYDQRITNTNTRVSNAEGNISRVQRTVQNGNDNLVMNGAFISDTLNWSEWGEPSIREIVSVDGCKWMHIVTTSDRFQGYRQIHFSDFGITIKGGEKYTLSLRAFCASGTSKICVGFHWRSSAVSENILADWFPFDIDTEKKQYKVTFTVPETGTYEGQSYDIDHFAIMVGSNYEMQGVEGRNFYITDIKLEQGEIVTSWSDNVNDSYSQIKQTADALTVQINGKASTGYVDITASNVIAKINETGIDIENKKITMTAEQTLFKDLAGREMISFEMVNYNGESLPSLVFWDSRGKKNGEKAWVLNWRGLIDMMQNTVNPSFAEYDGMYGSIRTGGDSFTEGSKWYAETIWWLNQAHGGVRPSIDMVSKYLYSMGYTKQGSQVNPFPVGSENYDGKLYNSDDWDSVHLPTGTLVSGWYITSVTPYAQGGETYRKMFTFSHYDGGVQNATFVVCIDALYVYDIHGQIVSTYYQIYGTMTDSSVQTGSDMGGEYMIIPTVNNSNNS